MTCDVPKVFKIGCGKIIFSNRKLVIELKIGHHFREPGEKVHLFLKITVLILNVQGVTVVRSAKSTSIRYSCCTSIRYTRSFFRKNFGKFTSIRYSHRNFCKVFLPYFYWLKSGPPCCVGPPCKQSGRE